MSADILRRVSNLLPVFDRIRAAIKYGAFSAVTALFLMLEVSCAIFQPRDTPEGVVITVRASETTIPRVGALVCRPKTIERQGAMAFSVDVHVKRRDGDNCAVVTFTCPGQAESAETRVCVGDAPVDTGCRTAGGNPVRIEVTETFN